MKIITILFLFFSLLATGQTNNDLLFVDPVYDFGDIEESDGPVEHEFIFTNNSDHPVKILKVRASCGCTTPGWTREEIAPGEKGYVKAKYNPINRPGIFNKSLLVTTNAQPNTYTLRIKGKVNPRVRAVEEEYPVMVGSLRFKSKSFNIGKISTNRPQSRIFYIYNYDSLKSITIGDNVEAPPYISVRFEPNTIQPRQKGIIRISFDGKARNDFGFLVDNIAFTTDEDTQARKEFQIYSLVEEYFPPMTNEQLALAPKLVLGKKIIDFGKIEQKTKVISELAIFNQGKSDLSIRRIKSTCGCLVINSEKDVLKPGESEDLTVILDPKGLSGTQQSQVTIFSNDPKGSSQRVLVKAYINN